VARDKENLMVSLCVFIAPLQQRSMYPDSHRKIWTCPYHVMDTQQPTRQQRTVFQRPLHAAVCCGGGEVLAVLPTHSKLIDDAQHIDTILRSMRRTVV
jgi:hypothetical protein